MKAVPRIHIILIIITVLAPSLFGQTAKYTKFDKTSLETIDGKLDILSARNILKNAQDGPGRLKQEVWQDWSTTTSQFENNLQYLYTYGGDYDKLTEFTSQIWNNGQWDNQYLFNNFYDDSGFDNMYIFYQWTGTYFDIIGTGTYSDHDANGNYGTEVYQEWNSTSGTFEDSQKWEYNYDSNGNKTDEYLYSWENSAWVPSWWDHWNFQNGCLDYYAYYSWDGSTYIKDTRYDYTYDNGCNDPIPYADWWITDGSPSQWIYSTWDGAAWIPQLREVYDINNCGWPTSATQYNNYDSGSMTWSEGIYRNDFTYNDVCGTTKPFADIFDSNTRLTIFETQTKENGQWINFNRAWISYEDLELDAELETMVPDEFTLAQNYPNPFNPNTAIDFSISIESNVNLSIYDLSGKLIKEIVNTRMNAGNKSLIWNGTDNNGSKVGAGVYLYKLQTDNFTESKKMILLK